MTRESIKRQKGFWAIGYAVEGSWSNVPDPKFKEVLDSAEISPTLRMTDRPDNRVFTI